MAYIVTKEKNININESATIQDGYELENLEIYGNTTQASTTGKNLLSTATTNGGDNNYWSQYTTYDKKTGTLTRSTTATTETTIQHRINLKNNTKYTISCLAKSNGYVSSLEIYAYNSTVSKIYHLSPVSLTTEYQKYTFTFTTDSTTDFTNAVIRFDNNGSTQSGTEAILTITDVMLVEGENTDFEPYTNGASPNPDYPQPINVVSGRQEVSVVGKNLFGTTLQQGYYAFINGNYVSSSNNYVCSTDFISVESGKTYTLSFKGNSNNYGGMGFIFYNNGTYVNYSQLGNNVVTIPSGVNQIKFDIYNPNGITPSNIYEVQLELGSTASEYEEYKGQSYEINLGKNLFDNTKLTPVVEANTKLSTIETGVRATLYGTVQYASARIVYKDLTNYVGKTIRLKSNFTASSTNNGRYKLGICDSQGNNAQVKATTTTSGETISFVVPTLSDTIKYLYLEFYGNNNGTGVNQSYVDYTNVILTINDEDMTYTPYKTPIELCKINTYKDMIFRSKGVNLFDKDTIITGKYIDGSGNFVNDNNNFIGALTKIDNIKTYYVNAITGNTKRIAYYDSTQTFISRQLISTYGGTLTIPNNAEYLRLSCYNADLDTLQLNEGSTALPYEPYNSKGKWLLHKEIGKVVLNGSESWNDTAITGRYINNQVITNGITLSNTIILISNYFKGIAYDERNNISYASIYLQNNYLGVNNSGFTSTSEVQTWLTTHNTTVYYVLATPTTTEITDSELISQLNAIELLEGLNNVSVSSEDLSAPLKLSYYAIDETYYDIIYSQDTRNDLKIWFNDVELEDAPIKCEKIERTDRILASDGNKIFSLNNFVSTSLEVILHNVDLEDIQDQVKISIGTLVDANNNIYKYVPLGIFNIQDKPENDNGKITLKLRDNRVKFDFNYNAKPLIDSLGGVATKKQMLDDICSQAGVTNLITSFEGEDDELAIYDNTIQATNYVAFLMEQAGLIPKINRYGELIALDLNESHTWRIPLSLLESGFEIGEPYKIDRVVYESGIIKYETSDDETLDTLYLDSSNPYITNQAQVYYIYDKFKDFQIDSVLTKRCIGNPCIDSYDLIEIYNDLDNSNDVVFKTLANTTYTYNGKHQDVFDTQIGKEQRTENVSLKGEASFKNYAKTTINNLTADVDILSVKTQNLEDGTYTKQQVDDLLINAETGLTNTFSEAGGNNIFRNTGLWFSATSNEAMLFPNSDVYPNDELFMGNKVIYEFWSGNVKKLKNDKAVNMSSLLLMNDILSQEQIVPNGKYTISFKYKKIIELSNISVKINDVVYPLESNNETSFIETIDVSSQHISLQFISDIDESCEIYDLMVNVGETSLAYSQNQNETTTDTVNISKGITITSSNTNTTFKADSDGIRIFDEKSYTNDASTKFTNVGMETNEAKIKGKSQIVGTLWQEVGKQTWLTRL